METCLVPLSPVFKPIDNDGSPPRPDLMEFMPLDCLLDIALIDCLALYCSVALALCLTDYL
jgi:hypothetical protein